MSIKVGLVILSLLALLLLDCASTPGEAKVIQVIDGDTIVIEGGYHVRYIGIDAPERDELYYEEAKQANQEVVEGKLVRLERDVSEKDDYGRLLRYVYVGDTLVNAELVKLGYAEAKAYPPDTEYQGFLEGMEREAKEAGRGMWGSSS